MKDSSPFTGTRSWRDIPQHVKPRAMSREGRRRLRLRAFRAACGIAMLGLVAWAVVEVVAVLKDDPKDLPAAANTGVIKTIALATDGVLDRTWLAHQLALPKNATLMGVDLERLRARLLASGQVRTAAIVRNFPATLSVSMSERKPVARLMAQAGGQVPKALLVARDGVVYDGAGYEPATVNALPWLDGVKLVRQGGGFAPIEGMDTAADLLARAQLEAEPVYRTWRVVSLARLESDGEIEMRTGDGLKVVFGTQEDFLKQIAKLDLLLDVARARPDQQVREINLSLGGQVPVAVAAPASEHAAAPVAPANKAVPDRAPRFHIQYSSEL